MKQHYSLIIMKKLNLLSGEMNNNKITFKEDIKDTKNIFWNWI